jgi:GNAT superfamily N-acetyltransferase
MTQPVKKRLSPIVSVHPLTEARWPDLLTLFGPGGACFGCWCQYWRRPRAEWRRAKAAENKSALETQARSDQPPGLIGYDASGAPVGWVSLGPREDFPGLRNSRFFGDTPDAPGLWSVVCFFVPAAYRGSGVAAAMLAGAVRHARRAGARVLEAYPWDLGVKSAAASSLYVGTLPMFAAAGFREVSRRVPHRPIVRRRV